MANDLLAISTSHEAISGPQTNHLSDKAEKICRTRPPLGVEVLSAS